jgi:DNA-binding response OmpR family regulator
MKAVDCNLRGGRILIAEDDAILALDVREIFQQAGAEVIGPVATLRQALAMICNFPVSAALLDVNLRDGEVFPAALALKERGIGMVFYTGYADVDGLRRDWPGAQVLTKPAPPRLLVSAMSETCLSASESHLSRVPAPSLADRGAQSPRDRI